jgi:hypothetical protein
MPLDVAEQRKKQLTLNLERLKLLLPALLKVGFPEFRITRDDTVICAIYGPVVVRVQFEQMPTYVQGEMIICRNPERIHEKQHLSALLKSRRYMQPLYDKRYFVNDAMVDVKLVVNHGFVAVRFFEVTSYETWEVQLAGTLKSVVDGYIASMAV